MYPPTPTPLPPPSTAPLIINSDQWRIWAFADDAIQLWQSTPNSMTQALQIAAILAIVIGAIYVILWILRHLTRDEDVK